MEQVYTGYDSWKGWDTTDFMTLTDLQRRYYDDELRQPSLDGRDVLEIGFGAGTFLAWARERGASLYGTESLPALREIATAAGVHVLPIDLSSSLPDHEARFAAVVAFDVMEHLTIEQNRVLLDQVARLLADGGLYVARFPNGQSPFGRVYQHGDMTHRSTLSAEIIAQLVQSMPFEIVHLGNQAASRPNGLRGIGAKGRALLQRVIERSIAKIYGMSAPLGPNTVAVLRRRAR